MKQIHGHEVIRMMVSSGKAYTKAALVEGIISTFGNDARFYTCSADSMTAEELVLFLESAGKLVPATGGFQIATDKVCGQ